MIYTYTHPQTVSNIAKNSDQPRGGLLPLKNFTKTKLDDGRILAENENLHGSTVASATEYLTRVLVGEDPRIAFSPSLLGASNLRGFLEEHPLDPSQNPEEKPLQELLNEKLPADETELALSITGTDDESIRRTCRLVGYDVCYRQHPVCYAPLKDANEDTIRNIRILAERGAHFLQLYGPVTHPHYQFKPSAYTAKVGVGEPDFLTSDTLWDFKCVRKAPSSQNTLQLLLYYLMGMHSDPEVFGRIKNLGIYNPRHNTVYTMSVEQIHPDIIALVNRELLGY